MHLIQPPYPEQPGRAGYYHVHAEHRRTAIDHAIGVIRDDAARELQAMDDPLLKDLASPVGEWAVEILVQGAWMREFHEWEKATKTYFEGQHRRNGRAPPKWTGPLAGVRLAASHVQRVEAELMLFGATVPAEVMSVIDGAREAVNRAKHREDHFVTEADHWALVDAVGRFWDSLSTQEAFNAG